MYLAGYTIDNVSLMALTMRSLHHRRRRRHDREHQPHMRGQARSSRHDGSQEIASHRLDDPVVTAVFIPCC